MKGSVREGKGAEIVGRRAGQSNPFLREEPRVTVGGNNEGVDRAHADVDQPLLRNEPEKIPADGSSSNPKGGDGGGVEQTDPSLSNPPIFPSEKPEGM